jgi:hypothetical protein
MMGFASRYPFYAGSIQQAGRLVGVLADLKLNGRLMLRSWQLPPCGFLHRIDHISDTKILDLYIYTLGIVWIPVLSNLFSNLRRVAVFYFGVSRQNKRLEPDHNL